jgi:hypothetical protein
MTEMIEREWQPIATVPKDGTTIILGWLPNGTIEHAVTTRWMGTRWCGNYIDATHWKPLQKSESNALLDTMTEDSIARRIERKMAEPVACADCSWHGKMGEVRSRGSDPAGSSRCPVCDGFSVILVQPPSTKAIQ